MRPVIFSTQVCAPLSFESTPGDKAKHQIFSDFRNFLHLTENLIQDLRFGYQMIEELLACRFFELPKAKTPKQIYSDQCVVRKENELGKDWYEKTKVFKTLFRVNLAFSRMKKALHEHIDSKQPLEGVAEKWDVSPYELNALLDWYENHAKPAYGEKPPNFEIWSQVIDEEQRFKDLELSFKQHAMYKLRSPKFSYLINFYECQDSLVQHLMPAAWYGILTTSHRPEVESLKSGKKMINTTIHHMAREITESMKKQEYDAATDTNVTIEFPLFSNPDMDESKFPFLAQENEDYRESEVLSILEKVLNNNERLLVDVLMGVTVDPNFENFAVTIPSRRLAAFQFYHVDPAELRIKFSLICD